MEWDKALADMREVAGHGINLGLGRMRELCERLGNPQNQIQWIHLAGTNGKGSTAAYISSILAACGYVVGRYVSPAVFQYEESFQYEDRRGIHWIDRELLMRLLRTVTEKAGEMSRDGGESPTVFEMETAVSFLAFLEWGCPLAILEVGLGGREDATNIIENSLISVITPISFDHMNFLGESLEEIARAKAGIIKTNGNVVTYQKEERALSVIKEECRKKGAALAILERGEKKVVSADLQGTAFLYRGEEYQTVMPGSYQVENACLALESCRHLPIANAPSIKQKQDGICRAVWRGRFDVVSTRPLMIFDGAHNVDGARALAASLDQLLSGKVLHGVMGVFRDKEYGEMVRVLAPFFSDVIVVTAPGERGLEKEILAGEWRKSGCPSVSMAATLEEARDQAVGKCAAEDAVIVFGSLSILNKIN